MATDPVNFEFILYENSPNVTVIYGETTERGSGSTEGAQRDATDFDQYACNTANSVPPGLRLDYIYQTLGLTPATATNAVGEPHTVTATFNRGGAPVAGAAVLFTVTPTGGPGGAPPGALTPVPASGAGVTNASGQATFTFTSARAGNFTIQACIDENANAACDAGELRTTARKTFADVTAPTCVVVIGANQIRATVQDPESGIVTISRDIATNVTVTGAPATFSPPTYDAQVVVATRINRSQPFRLEITVTNAAGISTTCDPVLATMRIGPSGKAVTKTYSGIPRAEHKLTIRGFQRGVIRAVVLVNGQTFRLTVNGKKATQISIASAMNHGRNNSVKITLYGKAGARALVALTD